MQASPLHADMLQCELMGPIPQNPSSYPASLKPPSRYAEVGVLLCLFVIIAEFFSTHRGVPLSQDIAALLISLLLLNLSLTKKLHFQELWKAQLFRIASTASVAFFLLWWSRWLGGARVAQTSPLFSQDRAYLQLGALLALLNFLSTQAQIRNWWKTINITPGRKVLGTYIIACLTGSAFLILPWVHQPGKTVQLIDAFFITVSAISVTGLSPIDVASYFTLPGLAAILLLIQLGGWGVVAISVALVILTRNRLSLSESQMGLELYDIPETGRFTQFLRNVMITTLGFETLGALAIYFSLPSDLDHRWFHSIFLSISAFCNAGFSSLEGNLENPLTLHARFPIGLLIVIGGIGFPVLFELKHALQKAKARAQNLRMGDLSIHVTLTLGITLALLIGGWIALNLTESLQINRKLQGWDQVGQTLFYSASARTAGFNVLPVDRLAFASQMILVFLMVIGGSPLSTAGGIKTTTAGIIAIAVWNFLRGRKWIEFRNREISPLALQKAVVIISLYTIIAFLALLALLITEQQDAWSLTFEIVSALSTTGLSVGATPSLSPPGKLIVSTLMLTGRIGLITVAVASLGRAEDQNHRYPLGKIYIG